MVVMDFFICVLRLVSNRLAVGGSNFRSQSSARTFGAGFLDRVTLTLAVGENQQTH